LSIRSVVVAIVLIFAVAPAFADSLSSTFGVYVYPKNKQNQTQQTNDESVCYKSAKGKTGVDPANLPPATPASVTQHQGGAVRGAAGGAAVGAIAGNAGTGAGIGATLGAVRGRRTQTAANNAEQHYAHANAQAQQSQSMNNFRRAYAACLESKGYVVK